MADPTGTNLSLLAAKRAERADPNFDNVKLGQRLRNLRTDLDAGNSELLINNDDIDLDAGAVSKDYVTDGQVYVGNNKVDSNNTDALTITNPVIGGLLIINVSSFGGVAFKLKIGAGSAMDITRNKTSTLVITSATTARVLAVI